MAARINKMHQLMNTVMRREVHYGTIPGCAKPTLFLPGAQVIKVAFKIGTRYTVEDISGPGEKAFRVTAEVFDQASGAVLGYGVGECSSSEEKYAWRKAVCDQEYDAATDDQRRLKWDKGGNTTKQIRTNPADIANTVLKMATKRADIHGTINATSASDIFTQDIEDLPEGMELDAANKAASTKPRVTPNDVTEAPRGSIVGVVESVDVKTGSGKKGPWSRYGVKINGAVYGTFDTKIGDLAKTLQGKQVAYTFTDDGKYKNLATIAPIAAAPAAQPEQDTSVMDAESFAALVNQLSLAAGIPDIDGVLEAEFGVKGGALNIPANLQASVIDFLQGNQQQPGV
jgi:hypothetical protein